ncbi:peptide/nickel transport system ATP-binding protein/oligopeptide transport system ATP-binding protein [Bacillus pakistanensis]|uniref:Peptide/nickel transport system ATP-binding protein/oligopeptide transport system ATP-binding protein n=1 Tax=Rossellomorea pakistanensis TaxID=992288 RepID=A0ABS2NE41_9BACI|nr:oligopeptide/dipeptide ABC transporter ATP-binding protein [Bacillus pakistanensis]MBM7586126.1 peptide/nickel transport system ATP-binding protein/oligopeptide transport system ATP-binding protein [Bacillus pakistanensis]
MPDNILEICDVRKHFNVGHKQIVKSVDGITFSIKKGETLGIVGESGSGKSTIGRTIVGLYEATAGKVVFEGKDISQLDRRNKRDVNRRMQMIFQDPYASLNPRMRVGDIVAEGIEAYGLAKGKAKQERVFQLLERVGLNPDHAARFPHEFSGGQRQRIGIARALAVEPSYIVADEPISALDVSIQAQIVNLLEDLQKQENLTYLFIAHDLAMVKHISDRIGVMYLGKMMELADSRKLFQNPLHPYTKALLSAIPVPNPKLRGARERIVLGGELPSPINPPSGCPFRTRCPSAMDHCAKAVPEWKEVQENHWVACHLY